MAAPLFITVQLGRRVTFATRSSPGRVAASAVGGAVRDPRQRIGAGAGAGAVQAVPGGRGCRVQVRVPGAGAARAGELAGRRRRPGRRGAELRAQAQVQARVRGRAGVRRRCQPACRQPPVAVHVPACRRWPGR